jgi:hypothetical protein
MTMATIHESVAAAEAVVPLVFPFTAATTATCCSDDTTGGASSSGRGSATGDRTCPTMS